jgi:hypothetical protein
VCVAPFVARGATGEEEYPECWMGGIGEVSSFDKWELHEACRTTTQSGILGIRYTSFISAW